MGKELMPEQNYLNLIDTLSSTNKLESFKTIVELGARDCNETRQFRNTFPKAKIYTFECNEATLPKCRKVVAGLKNVKLIEKAVSCVDGEVTFYPIDQNKTNTTWEDGNPGASSLFKASGKYPVENYVQKEVVVESCRLDTFMQSNKIQNIDLLWMDIQGGERDALKSLGAKLSNVKYIHTEVEFIEIYKEQPLFKDIKKYLNKNGFYFYKFTTHGKYSGDALFVNKKLSIDELRGSYFQNVFYPLLYKLAPVRSKIRSYNERLSKAWKLYFSTEGCDHNIRRGLTLIWIKKLKPHIIPQKDMGKVPKIDVVIPIIEKDLPKLQSVVEGVREHIFPKTKTIIVVAPRNSKIQKACKDLGVTFVEESKASPVNKSEIKYKVDGKDRSGWLFQQLIKLSADQFVTTRNFLVLDADTVFVSKAVLMNGNKTVYPISDEYHKPYYEEYERLMGERPKSLISFVSHYMVFNKDTLKSLKNHIETLHGMPWYDAILKTIDHHEASGFSEYETYGNYVLSTQRAKTDRRLLSNVGLQPDDANNLQIIATYAKYHTTISFHTRDE